MVKSVVKRRSKRSVRRSKRRVRKSKKVKTRRSRSYGRHKKRGKDSNWASNSEDDRSDRYLMCPYCDAEYTSSRDLIKLGTGTIWTTKARRLYGCYNCKRILGVASRDGRGD
jgi:hypothetical protein